MKYKGKQSTAKIKTKLHIQSAIGGKFMSTKIPEKEKKKKKEKRSKDAYEEVATKNSKWIVINKNWQLPIM